ncbi:DUF6752 domain-containing protein [Klenkia brasiliensis]|uniref:DUF6752 domain-containing protein n=1 Tax=Klenkia brasiliensis TaxID=333142 RepID=A0A1G7RF70_9ACTN|nr:DUF6752 domain-containing protein [Klenkia brasiliensis]SDG09398.1 hypothetical protein SAMN05660324_1879 [Klenkia brasiliensis]
MTTSGNGLGQALPVRAVRRVLAPAALELRGQVLALQEQVAGLDGVVAELRSANAELRDRVGSLEAAAGPARVELDRLRAELAELREGLHEQRRLQLRVAEVTDLVTEVVLPLHDREVDPAVLGRLRPDTL